MATNLPEALDQALLRPGRIDRIYKVGYPSKAGRIGTYKGYFDKVTHDLTEERGRQARHDHPVRDRRHDQGPGERVADQRDPRRPRGRSRGRTSIKAKQLKKLGPPEDVEYIERERHAVAVHEACHAVAAYRCGSTCDRHRHDREGRHVSRHGRLDPAGGPVHALAVRVRGRHHGVPGLAGRRAPVLRRRQLLRRVRGPRERHAARHVHGGLLGHGLDRGLPRGTHEVGIGGGGQPGDGRTRRTTQEILEGSLGQRIEVRLDDLLARARELLAENRREVSRCRTRWRRTRR